MIHPSIDISSIETTNWTAALLSDYEKKHRTIQGDANTITIFIAYLPGSIDETTIGQAYGNTSFAVFMDQTSSDNEEKIILLHEFGHLLGLVRGSHKDSAHGYHCQNRKCAMYWVIEYNQDDFDQDCQEESQEQFNKNSPVKGCFYRRNYEENTKQRRP